MTKVKNHLLVVFLLVYLFAANAVGQTPSWAWASGGTRTGYSELVNCIGTDATGFVYIATGFAAGTSFDTSGTFAGGMMLLKYNPAGNLLWGKPIGGGTSAMYTDQTGNCYITGAFIDTLSIGSDTLISIGNSDLYIAKFDSAGNGLWAKQAGGPHGAPFPDSPHEKAYSIAIDQVGNSYVGMMVLSSANQPATFGSFILYPDFPGSYPNTPRMVSLIAKYTTNGTLVWVRKIDGNGGKGSPIGLAVTPAGECYFTGYFTGNITLGGTSLSSNGNKEICIGRLSTDGTFKWVKSFGSSGDDMGAAVAINNQHEIVFAGTYRNNMQVGSFSLTGSPNYANAYLVTCDSAGNIVHATQTLGLPQVHTIRLAPDAVGGIYMASKFYGDLIIGNQTYISSSYGDVAVMKWSNAGLVEWIATAPSTNYGSINGIVLTPDQTACYVYGSFQNTIVFGNTTLYESEPYEGFFLAKLENIVTGRAEEVPEANWSVYPNPTSGLLHLKLPFTAQPVRAILTDARGQEVYATTLSGAAEATLELRKLAAGIYVLSVQTEKEVLKKKVLIR